MGDHERPRHAGRRALRWCEPRMRRLRGVRALSPHFTLSEPHASSLVAARGRGRASKEVQRSFNAGAELLARRTSAAVLPTQSPWPVAAPFLGRGFRPRGSGGERTPGFAPSFGARAISPKLPAIGARRAGARRERCACARRGFMKRVLRAPDGSGWRWHRGKDAHRGGGSI